MAVRLSKVAREFNVGLSTIVEFLHSKGIKVSSDPNAKLTDEDYSLIANEFSDVLPSIPKWELHREVITMPDISMYGVFSNATLAEIDAYIEELKSAGFTENEKRYDTDILYSYTADHKEGKYRVIFTFGPDTKTGSLKVSIIR